MTNDITIAIDRRCEDEFGHRNWAFYDKSIAKWDENVETYEYIDGVGTIVIYTSSHNEDDDCLAKDPDECNLCYVEISIRNSLDTYTEPKR